MAKTLIKSLTASSSASLEFVDGTSSVVMDSTYPVYEFHFINLHAQTNNVYFTFQVNATDGADYNDSAMTSTMFAAFHDEPSDGTFAEVYYDGTHDNANSTNETRLSIFVANANDDSISGKMTLYDPSSTTYIKHFSSRISNAKTDPAASDTFVGGYINDTTAIDEIRFKMSSGNIDAGTIKMFGVS